MGAEQSSTRAAGGGPAGRSPRKTCYYELLGLDRQATDDEKAYKKKALELHPDRNLGDTDNATRKFAEVQTAYEVLSDPQERAWYDSHREAILHGDDDGGGGLSEHGDVGTTTAEDLFTLMGRFNSSVPFDDSPDGFFGILAVTFAKLAREELAAREWDGKTLVQYPPFGGAGDPFDLVAKPFYGAWSSFATSKSFSWKDKYRLSDAPDRRVRRLMEKENKKFRDEGVRDFNDAVRSLVAFVRKRDPRYVPNTQSEAERQKILRDSAAAQAARSRAANQENLAAYVLPEWARSRQDGHDQLDDFSVSEEESEIEQIECVVCQKTFKSEKQFEAHEKSKKHTKAVQQLQRQMKRENQDFHLSTVRAEAEPPEDAPTPEAVGGVPEEDNPVPEEDAPVPEEDAPAPQKAAVPAEADGAPEPPATDSGSEDDGDYAPRDAVESRLLGNAAPKGGREKAAGPETDDNDVVSGVDGLHIDEPPTAAKKVGMAKAKREKKAARQAAGEQQQHSHKCSVCQVPYPSRTKLFDHLRKDHAAEAARNNAKAKKTPK